MYDYFKCHTVFVTLGTNLTTNCFIKKNSIEPILMKFGSNFYIFITHNVA